MGLVTPPATMPSGKATERASPRKRPMAAPGHRLSVRMGARLTCFPEPSPPGDQSQHHTGEAGGRVATALSQHPEPQTLDSPKINMGMKYPAGRGIVVARISIQNCGENGAGLCGRRLEAAEEGPAGAGSLPGGGGGPGAHRSAASGVSGGLSRGRTSTLAACLLCAWHCTRASRFFPPNLL